MAVVGTLLAKAVGGFGKKPDIPELPRIDPSQVQRDTAAGNLAVLPQAQKLGSAINTFNRREALRALEEVTPGATRLLQTGTEQLQSFLRGEIPEDVVSQVRRQLAERSFGGGFGGSGAADVLTAEGLRDTSLGLIEAGINSAQQWLAGAQQLTQPGGFFDVSSMFFTPQDRARLEFEGRAQRFQRDLLKEQVDAAPDPFKAALGQAFIQEEAQIVELAGSVGGMMAMACWVARVVFGVDDMRWRMFRMWLMTDAPAWFRRLYLKHGERFAAWLKDKPKVRAMLEPIMQLAVNKIGERYGITHARTRTSDYRAVTIAP